MNQIIDAYAELERGMVVQIEPTYAPEQFGGMFLVVEEVYEYGILGYLNCWGNQATGPIYVRVPFGRFQITGGRVQWSVEKWMK